MTEIDVPDWVVQLAVDEMTRVPPESEGQWFSRDIEEVMRACITAALGAWVVPQHQCMSNDEDDIPNGLRDIWMDVSADDYQKLTTRKDVRGRTLYTLRQEKPE